MLKLITIILLLGSAQVKADFAFAYSRLTGEGAFCSGDEAWKKNTTVLSCAQSKCHHLYNKNCDGWSHFNDAHNTVSGFVAFFQGKVHGRYYYIFSYPRNNNPNFQRSGQHVNQAFEAARERCHNDGYRECKLHTEFYWHAPSQKGYRTSSSF